MGWEYTIPLSKSKIFKDMYEDPKFYFVHSYYVKCSNQQEAIIGANYMHPFHAGIEKDTIVGVQFHPEKSHKYGMKLLENFAKNY
jgi:glutamine amidotransferase